jgi:hypothetical protein
VGQQQECAICGVVYSDAQKHQQFHDDIAAWIHLIELEVDARIRSERRRAEG